MVATQLRLVVETAWSLLVHPETTTHPLMAIDWIREQIEEEDTTVIKKGIYEVAADWCAALRPPKENEYWCETGPALIKRLREGGGNYIQKSGITALHWVWC